jgi:hypothetical protein
MLKHQWSEVLVMVIAHCGTINICSPLLYFIYVLCIRTYGLFINALCGMVHIVLSGRMVCE